jgi:mannitol-1-/sugar-/sorbitol-6-phosphatase
MTIRSIPTLQPAARVLLGQAVLFDCDGVLVDSDPSVVTAWSRWATEFGLVPAAVVAVVHGRRAVDTVAALLAADRHAEALALINRYEIEDASTVRPIPGADQLLRSLPTGTWAVVTSALSGLARARISASGLPTPTHLITADLVTRGKPDPEGYLVAAQRLDMRPGDCIVIEDAVEGVAAARAAGVATVVGVGERVTHAPIDFHVPDLTALTWTDDGLTVRTSHPAPNPGD